MKKILIIVKRPFGSKHSNTQLINEYVETKKSQGYQLELIGDDTGVLKELLDEQELWGKKITSAQSNVMFELGSYELIIYVPEEAADLQDILVYDPNKLDKNMIFYNIGNMLIVDSLGEEDLQQSIGNASERENHTDDAMLQSENSFSADDNEQQVTSESFVSESESEVEEPMTETFDESVQEESVMADDAFEEAENQVSIADEAADMQTADEQNFGLTTETEFDASVEAQEDDSLVVNELSETQAQENLSTEAETNEAQDGSETDSSESDSTEVRDMQDDFSSNYSVIGENETPVTADEQKADEAVAPEIEESSGFEAASDSQEVSTSNVLDNIDEIHSDSLITISSEGVTTTSGESYAETSAQESVTESESVTEPEHPEVKKGVSIPRRLWLLVPWIIMGLMTILKYEKVAWIPFILSVLALFGAIISKKSRRLSKTPEFLCIIMAVLALIVNFVYPEWMVAIALPISIMAILLFFIVGFVNWDN
ncbi:MAG: hypothetical protein Q4D65_07010 [Peptostreptococcaceae bacterium]|nr:hypothetical protein [Peptostreptococcaceae bacterium]